jgi:hypothetical protein
VPGRVRTELAIKLGEQRDVVGRPKSAKAKPHAPPRLR